MKYYINKFLWLLLIMATLPLLSYGLSITIGAALGIPYEIFVAICTAFYVIAIAKSKIKNKEKQQQYFNEKENTPSKIKIIFRGKDWRSEVIVFLVLITPLMIKTLSDQKVGSVFEFAFLFLFTECAMGILYGLLSFIILLIVYSRWEKQE